MAKRLRTSVSKTFPGVSGTCDTFLLWFTKTMTHGTAYFNSAVWPDSITTDQKQKLKKGDRVIVLWEKKLTPAVVLFRGSPTSVSLAASQVERILQSTEDMGSVTDALLQVDYTAGKINSALLINSHFLQKDLYKERHMVIHSIHKVIKVSIR
jgi:uncharacterized protein (AIM24 family)